MKHEEILTHDSEDGQQAGVKPPTQSSFSFVVHDLGDLVHNAGRRSISLHLVGVVHGANFRDLGCVVQRR